MPSFSFGFSFGLNFGHRQPDAVNNALVNAANDPPAANDSSSAADGARNENQNQDEPDNNDNVPGQSNDNQNSGEEPSSSNAPDPDQSSDNQNKEESGSQDNSDPEKGKSDDGKPDAGSSSNNNNGNVTQPDHDDKPPANVNPDAADTKDSSSPDNDESDPRDHLQADSHSLNESQGVLNLASASTQSGQPASRLATTSMFGNSSWCRFAPIRSNPEFRGQRDLKRIHVEPLAQSCSSLAKVLKMSTDSMGVLRQNPGNGSDAGDSSSSGNDPSAGPPPPPPNRGFHVSDVDVSTWPMANQLDEQIKRGDYAVLDFQVINKKHGKVEFLSKVDLAPFGDVVDICKNVTIEHGLITFNVPNSFRLPTMRLIFDGITRDDFAKALGKNSGSEVTDEELKTALEILATKAGATTSEYHSDTQQWRMLILP